MENSSRWGQKQSTPVQCTDSSATVFASVCTELQFTTLECCLASRLAKTAYPSSKPVSCVKESQSIKPQTKLTSSFRWQATERNSGLAGTTDYGLWICFLGAAGVEADLWGLTPNPGILWQNLQTAQGLKLWHHDCCPVCYLIGKFCRSFTSAPALLMCSLGSLFHDSSFWPFRASRANCFEADLCRDLQVPHQQRLWTVQANDWHQGQTRSGAGRIWLNWRTVEGVRV